jgi:hypothetical protein
MGNNTLPALSSEAVQCLPLLDRSERKCGCLSLRGVQDRPDHCLNCEGAWDQSVGGKQGNRTRAEIR